MAFEPAYVVGGQAGNGVRQLLLRPKVPGADVLLANECEKGYTIPVNLQVPKGKKTIF